MPSQEEIARARAQMEKQVRVNDSEGGGGGVVVVGEEEPQGDVKMGG